jgi:hypothetical protein
MEAVPSQATSSTILPWSVFDFARPNTSPSGHSSHSSGTATMLPFLLLTQRVNSGLALGPRGSSSVPGVMSAACWAAMISALVRLLGACLLSSLLIVSIWWNCQYWSHKLKEDHVANIPFLPHFAFRSDSYADEPFLDVSWRVLPRKASSFSGPRLKARGAQRFLLPRERRAVCG